MIHCFIISTSDKFIEESTQFIGKNTYFKQISIKLKDKEDYIESISLFQYVTSFFTSITPSDLRESVVIIDEFFHAAKSKPIDINNTSDNFYARLILGFPELEFVFLNSTENGTKSIIDWLENEKVIGGKKNKSYVSIFDYTGIRNTLRRNINIKNDVSQNILPIRSKKARIIEDELSYAYFHGYIAYKRNHLSKLYTTLNHLDQEIGSSETVNLQLQDLSLGFIDKREDEPISDITDRYSTFAFLDINKDRAFENNDFFITVGNGTSNSKKASLQINNDFYEIVNKANPKKKYLTLEPKGEKNHYIFTNSKQGNQAEMCSICGMEISSPNDLVKKAKVLYKPTKGIYDIEEKLALGKWPFYNPPKLKSSIHRVRGVVEIEESPNEDPNLEAEQVYSNHSAAGILTFLAEQLILRAQNILDSAKNVVDAIHAATLALEAKELLNGLTPTLALQAFALQQKAEVTAECLFTGTEYNIKLSERFIDINEEVAYIVQQFSSKLRKKTLLNTQLSIIESLSGIYSNHRQFEEEIECLNKARKLSLSLMSIKLKIPKIKDSLDSVRNFAVLIFLLQIVFGFIYFLFLKWPLKNLTLSTNLNDWGRDSKIFIVSIISATKYFFTSDTSKQFEPIFKQYEPYSTLLLGFQGFCTLTSISILMALLYLKISRK